MLFVALAQLTVAATAPDTILVGERATIRVTATVSSAALPQLRPLGIAPFTIVESVTSSELQTDRHGRTRAETQLRLVVLADRPGTFLVAPFEARAGGEWARSRPLRIVVRGSAASREPPPIVARAPLEPNNAVNFRAMVMPETVYVGQQATYQVGLFVESSVRARLRRNPEFVAPEMRSMLTYDLVRAGRVPFARVEGGRRYEAHVFERAIFPLAPGRYVFPPARLTYAVPTSPSFFSREETQEAQTDSVTLIVLDVPDAGRPADYAGVVGRLSLTAQLDSARARVGDPLSLVVRVTGIGNVKLFPRPALSVPWASIVPAGERVNIDSAAPTVGGTKEFEWVLTPRTAGELELSPIRYPYFDPERRRYDVAESAPIPISVAPGSLVATTPASDDSVAAMPIRREWRGAPPTALYEQPAFWLTILFAPVPAIGLGLVRRPRRGVATSASRTLRAVTRRAGRNDIGVLRRAFVGALAERLNLGARHFAVSGALSRSLRRAGVSTETAQATESLLGLLDDAAFARDGAPSPDFPARAWKVFRSVDREARERSALESGLLVALTALALGGVARVSASSADGAGSFAKGVQAYDGRHFERARAHFADAARAVPAASEAWANYGTAGWASSDTAAASVGWQRALRLEPLAMDVRERAELVHPLDVRSIGWVAPIPLQGLAVLGALLWLGAWALAVLRLSGRDRWSRDWGIAAGAVALLIASGGWTIRSRRTAEDLAVVAGRGTLRALPALIADATESIAVGEIARTVGRRGAWTRIALDGGREGWIASETLVRLDARGAALAP